jgi:hypothetical protein
MCGTRRSSCGFAGVDIQSAIKRMKGPDYGAPLVKLKSSVRKTIAALEPLGGEAIDYLDGAPVDPLPGVLPRFNVDGLMELQTFGRTARRLLAMPKPDHLIELVIDPGEEPACGYSGGDGPGGRRKWRNAVVTAMVHQLIENANIPISRTGKSIYSEGSPSMKLMACVLDCLDPRKRRRNRHRVEARCSH